MDYILALPACTAAMCREPALHLLDCIAEADSLHEKIAVASVCALNRLDICL